MHTDMLVFMGHSQKGSIHNVTVNILTMYTDMSVSIGPQPSMYTAMSVFMGH